MSNISNVNTTTENVTIEELIENCHEAFEKLDACFAEISTKWSEENKKAFAL